MNYDLPMESYKPRLKASAPSGWHPVACPVTVPVNGVELPEGSLFRTALERNTAYLLNSFTVDHMLHPFRMRHGNPIPSEKRAQVKFWDTELRGSNAGRFMMGASNTLRWIEHAELRRRLDELIDGIEGCREPNGYILPYPPILDSLRAEEPNYARAWLTHGLIDAAISGNKKAYGLLRGHADFFNNWHELHPRLLYWAHNNHQGHIASTRTYLSPVGKPEDLQLAERFYVCDWWMDELAAREKEAVWHYPLQNPHSYLITSFEAYLDHYLATGDRAFLDASLGAWELIHENWEHVGGSIAICETQWVIEDGHRIQKNFDKSRDFSHPPKSYYIGYKGHTGETCGNAFWIKFNQRLHRLFPDNEKYAGEIEKSIYNVLLASQTTEGNIRYHAYLEGGKDQPDNGYNTCCEGQGTRILGSLPEYIYSLAEDGLYVNLYEPSTVRFGLGGQSVAVRQQTGFPFSPEVALNVNVSAPLRMKVRVRIPAWSAEKVDVKINGKPAAKGQPGSYLTLDRRWRDGDRIEFALKPELKKIKYTGVDTIPGRDRYALEYGPVLLACVLENRKMEREINFDAVAAESADSLHFVVRDDPNHYFIPYWMVSDEIFTVFPVDKSIDRTAE